MKEANKVGITLSVTFGILFVACLIIVLTVPGFYLFLANNFFHFGTKMDLSLISFNFSRILFGLIESIVIGWIIGYLFVTVYNRISKK